MIRGEFIRADGLVVPNNITQVGASALLQSALQGANLDMWLGLCDAVPDPALRFESLNEPALGVNGYARISMLKGIADWPTMGTVNGENYAESKQVEFTASGGAFSEQVRRLFLCFSESELAGFVFALSAPLPSLLTIDASTPQPQRLFKYRVYLR